MKCPNCEKEYKNFHKICPSCKFDNGAKVDRYWYKRNYLNKKKYKSICELCGNDAPKKYLEVDHKDGNHHNDVPWNLWVLCKYCHLHKTEWDSQGDSWTLIVTKEKFRENPKLKEAMKMKSKEWVDRRKNKRY